MHVWSFEALEEEVRKIRYQDWTFVVRPGDTGYLLQLSFPAPDTATPGVWRIHKGRKWYISPHSTKEEVIQTALLAVLVASEHEIREKFTYDGVPLFQPHSNLQVLMDAAKEKVLREEGRWTTS